jgi:kynurenine formamidase
LKIIDLTETYENNRNIKVKLQENLPVYLGYECYAYDLEITSHTGTYYETSAHLFREGKNVDQVPVENFFLKAVLFTLRPEQEGMIDRAELEEIDQKIKITPGEALLIYTPKTNRYFSYQAALWMVEKKISLLAASLKRFDTGFISPTGMFVPLFKANIPIIGNIKNLDKISQIRFQLFVFPLKVKGVCTLPCRVIAVEREANLPPEQTVF